MDEESSKRRMGYWRGDERTLIRVFQVMFLSLTAILFIYDLLVRGLMGREFYQAVLGIGQDLVVAYALTSSLLGIVFIRGFKGEGIVPMRDLLVTMVQVAVVVALFFTVLYGIDVGGWADTGLHDAWDEYGPSAFAARDLVAVAAFGLMTFGGTLLAEAVILIGAFGLIGVIYTLGVGGAPRLIRRMEAITREEDLWSRAVMWFFGVPGALDTDVVLVDEPAVEDRFPWDRFQTAVLWQVLFGVILGVYVSLNPWLLREMSMDQLFRFMSTAFVVLPIIVIPWFIHRRLNARFKGVNRDFHFYKAFRDRLTSLMVAAGTLLIFVRFAWESSSPREILAAFSSYLFIMVLCIIVFTFVYFNFFENRLALETYRRWVESGMGPGGSSPVTEQDVSTDGD